MKIDVDDIGNAYTMVAANINTYLAREQGVRLGDSCVVSLKAHDTVPMLRGHVKVLTNWDAGMHYLKVPEAGQFVNMTVYHRKGDIEPVVVARRILLSIEEHLQRNDSRLTFMEGEKFRRAMDILFDIHIVTNGGRGTAYDLLMGRIEPADDDEEDLNHVRVLLPLSKEQYSLILPIAEGVEDALMEDEGVELARVKRVYNAKGKENQAANSKSGGLMIPWKKLKNASPMVLKANQHQLMMKLVERFGSVDDVRDFLEAQSGSILNRRSKEAQKRKWGDMEEHIKDLEEMGLLKKSWTGTTNLTNFGEEVKKFLVTHECEIAAEMRRNLRKVPKGTGRFHKMVDSRQHVSRIEFNNHSKTRRAVDSTRSGNLAVPETIVRGKIASLMRRESRLSIKREDIRIYDKRSYIPMNLCLVIDTSFSMQGEKKQAAFFLAQHLLITGRDKVAVVTFMDKDGRVIVPFTKNQRMLSRGLAGITPQGMTPMADGIVKAIDLIKSVRLDNPTMVLITDGMPNVPLWTFDAEKDALDAAQRIADNKINFLCIGVEANKEYLTQLAETGHGKLYVVDNLSRSNLINIVRHERKMAVYER
ncbi:MAG: vWA domain-containing protein [Acidobacteriota bacterium]